MPSGDVFKYGSKWIRADFHLHTRCDQTFRYDDDDDRYLSNYVNALKTAEIGIGVITNHNQFDYDEFIALRRNARKQDIMLLPGVELRIKEGANGIHTLVVFSDEWLNGGDYINEFLSSVFEGRSINERSISPTSCSLSEVINRLKKYDKDFFLVFAHVEDSSGLWRELDGGLIKALGQDSDFRERTLGFQKVRTYNQSAKGKVCRTKIRGWLKDWYPAEVEGSDPKSIEDIGKGTPCYLKLGHWSFDAVKYALIDHKVRVAKKPEFPKHSYIKDITFEGGVLDGTTIALSPSLNTLIGIRGSGKSSIIEAIRYALNIPLGDMVTKSGDMYKENLPAFVLGSGGKITIRTVDKHGQEYEVRRIYGEAPDVFINGTIQSGISLRETVLRNPIYFGQRDLSSTSEEFEKSLVDRLLGDKLSYVRNQIYTQKQLINESVARLKTLSNIEEKLEEYKAKKKNAEFRLRQYSTYGLEEKLEKQIEYDKDARKCNAVIVTARDYIADLENLLGQHEDELKNHLHYESSLNSEFFTDFFDNYKEIVATTSLLHEQIAKGTAAITKLEEQRDVFEKRRNGLKEEFAEIERKLAEELKDKTDSNVINTGEFRKLRATIDQSTQMLRVLEQQQRERQELEGKLQQELSDLKELWHQEFMSLKAELDKVNESDAPIEIVARFKGDKTSFLQFCKDIFRGSRIREDTFKSLVEDYADFIDMYKDLENIINSLNPTFRDAFRKLFGDYLSDLLTYQVPNQFEIRYHGVPLREHSLGQRASALILFILSQQDNDVIIIDQPEDDLDNQTIYEDVIKLVVRLKKDTQFIFATHNANFPVLGDAEQVVTCEFSSNGITAKTGSIDNPDIQQDIVGIMEGGEEAFNKRGRKYKAWKPQNF